MKKLFSKFMLVAVAALALTACEDVPEPYDLPGTGKNDPKGDIPEGTYLSETFSSDFGVFTCVTVKGTPWVIDYKTAKATGYDGSNTTESEAYLVSPAIDLSQSANAYLEFDYILRYVRAGSTVNNVLITSNYTGDPSTTTWTNITGKLTEGSDWTTFTKYQRNLPAEFIGQKAVVIALHYSCTSTSSTIEIKNLKLMEGIVEDEPITDETIGTAENPISTAEALKQINALSNGGKSTQKAYVKGKIVRIATNAENFAKYGNINYYISDDGTDNNTVQVYAGDGLNGEKFSSVNDIAAGDEVIVFGTLYKYVNNNSGAVVPEIEGSYLVSHVKGGGETPQPSGDAVGDGTLNNPYNAIAAYNVATALGSGNTSSESYYIKGKIASIKYQFDVEHGTATFFISDNGKDNNTFQVYSAYYLGNRSWQTGDLQIAIGDEVIIFGKLTNYEGTPETASKQAYLYSLNGKTEAGGGDTPGPQPSGDEGSINAPKTVADALAAINALEDGATSTAYYYIKGKVAKLANNAEDIGTKYTDVNYYISDDGSEANTLYIYRGKNLNNTDFTSASQLQVGDEVVIYGQLQRYVGNDGQMVPEMARGNYIVKTSNNGGDGEDPQPGGGEVGGTGSYSEPYSVAAVIANGTANTVQGVFIKGYIVGWVDGQVLASGAKFNSQGGVKTNLLIADNASETDVANCVPVQLPNNAVRTGLNLQDNPKYYGKQVLLYGNLEKYFGAAGVKNVTYAECDGDAMGSKP